MRTIIFYLSATMVCSVCLAGCGKTDNRDHDDDITIEIAKDEEYVVVEVVPNDNYVDADTAAAAGSAGQSKKLEDVKKRLQDKRNKARINDNSVKAVTGLGDVFSRLGKKCPLVIFDNCHIKAIKYDPHNHRLIADVHVGGDIRGVFSSDEDINKTAESVFNYIMLILKNSNDFDMDEINRRIVADKMIYGVRFTDDCGFDKYNDVYSW